MTLVLKVDPERPERERIARAGDLIRGGEVVAFPTETVYGLGGDAFSPKALEKIFLAKRRPIDNPLILHVSGVEQVREVALEVPPLGRKLIQEFWPGPLTLILKKAPSVPREATAGLDTVAVRMPDHRVALGLIEASSRPIAAPSANLSGRPSPTTAEHVREDFYSRIACILDSGRCRVGLESTVAMVGEDKITILRPGGVSREEMESAVGAGVEYYSNREEPEKKFLSPGMRYRHYAPSGELWLSSHQKLEEAVEEALRISPRVGVITLGKRKLPAEVYSAGESLEEYATNLYSALRHFDTRGKDIIVAQAVEERGIGFVAMNRLRKAATRILS